MVHETAAIEELAVATVGTHKSWTELYVVLNWKWRLI